MAKNYDEALKFLVGDSVFCWRCIGCLTLLVVLAVEWRSVREEQEEDDGDDEEKEDEKFNAPERPRLFWSFEECIHDDNIQHCDRSISSCPDTQTTLHDH